MSQHPTDKEIRSALDVLIAMEKSVMDEIDAKYKSMQEHSVQWRRVYLRQLNQDFDHLHAAQVILYIKLRQRQGARDKPEAS